MRKQGIGAIRNRQAQIGRFKEKKNELEDIQISSLTRQAETLKESLEKFAALHANRIKKNAEFRKHFQTMCASIGVDPISYSKGSWSTKLGLGDFYYKLGIKVVEICLAHHSTNGGLMSIDEVVDIANQNKGKWDDEICVDDIIRSVNQLSCLGNGFTVLKPENSKKMLIQSIPMEITMDASKFLGVLHNKKTGISVDDLSKEALQVAEELVKEGILWVDIHNDKTKYWTPSLSLKSEN